MAKNYTINTELNGRPVEVGLQKINSLVRATTQEANSLNKAMKITGNLDAGVKSTQGLEKALKLATDRSVSLKAALDKAKMDGSSANVVADLEAKLRRSDAEATNLKTALSGVNEEGRKGETDLLGTFSKIGNVASGLSAVFDILKNTIGAAIGKAIELSKTFANGFMESYDKLATANLTLKNTLKDGEKGLADYNNEMKKAPALVRAQKSELDQMASTMAAYSQVTGKEAFAIANAINAVGDSVGATTEDQKGFTLALGQAMTAGKLMAQDFNQMSQTALGTQFKKALIEAANELQGVATSSEEMSKKLQDGKISANEMNAVFGSDWRTNMAKAMQASDGVKTSVGMVNAAMKGGKISSEMFSKVLGNDYLEKLTAASNAQTKGSVTMENFRAQMEEGTFDTEVLTLAQEKLLQQAEKVPQVFNTFEQVQMSIKNAFYTGAVEGFLEKMVGAKGGLNEFGEAATEFSGNAGTKLGEILGIAAQKVKDFIDANGGISGVFDTMTKWVNQAGKALMGMAEDILVVIGNLLSLTKGTKELEKMGFQVDQTTGTVVGWKVRTEEATKKQEEWNKKLYEANSIMPTTTKELDKAAKASGNLEMGGDRGARGLDKVARTADFASNKLFEANEAANQAGKSVSNVKGTVEVDASGAVSQLSWLINWSDAASARLSGLSSNVGNFGRQMEFRDDSGKYNPLIESNFGAMRASQLYGSLEHYSASTAATLKQPPKAPASSGATFTSGSIQINVNGGNTDKAVAELEAKLRRLGIRIN